MAISSMTGFARGEGHHEAFAWQWEIKSVNGKGLDVRFRLPSGMDGLEPELRRRLAQQVKRGNCQIGLSLRRQTTAADLQLNRPVLDRVLELARDLRTDHEVAAPRLDGLLALKGVLEVVDPDDSDEAVAQRDQALLQSFDTVLTAFIEARNTEGSHLHQVLADTFAQIEGRRVAAEHAAAARPDALKAKLAQSVQDLLGANPQMPEERLAQELALLLIKADIREEIDRLKAHVQAAHELLNKSEPVGRRLDFLMQELNREANTLCSKSSDVELTRIGLDLKALIDQAREQVQNVE